MPLFAKDSIKERFKQQNQGQYMITANAKTDFLTCHIFNVYIKLSRYFNISLLTNRTHLNAETDCK